jgi:hypothetical protein
VPDLCAFDRNGRAAEAFGGLLSRDREADRGHHDQKLYSKTWANAELRKMLNIGGQKERE